MNNNFKTYMLIAALTAVLLVVGQMAAGRNGAVIALVLALVMNFFSYWYSDKIVLKMYRAKPIDDSEYKDVKSIVENIAASANIPAPRVYVIPESTPNAFATGRSPSRAVVALTRGILDGMDRNQLKGVIAHEIAHIKHSDTLISTVAATIAGAIGFIASMARWAAIFGGGSSRDNDKGGVIGLLVAAIVAPIAALIIQMAVSRSREYEADKEGAILAGNPVYLINALVNLSMYNKKQPLTKGNPSTAHMFIVNPFKLGGLNKLFSTHPPLEERIKRLQVL
jgi:heat shock protein HtpX